MSDPINEFEQAVEASKPGEKIVMPSHVVACFLNAHLGWSGKTLPIHKYLRPAYDEQRGQGVTLASQVAKDLVAERKQILESLEVKDG